jgi:hypothetical protein
MPSWIDIARQNAAVVSDGQPKDGSRGPRPEGYPDQVDGQRVPRPRRAPMRCPHCGRVATAVEKFFLQSPEGPVQHIKVGCPAGHWLIPHLGPGESRWAGPDVATSV